MLLGVLYVLSPLPESPLMQLLRGLFQRTPLSTQRDFLFVQNQFFWTLLNNRLKFADRRYLIVLTCYSLVWLALMAWEGFRILGSAEAAELLRDVSEGRFPRALQAILLTQVGFMVLGSLGLTLWILFRNTAEVAYKVFSRYHDEHKFLLGADINAVISVLHDSLLFRELPIHLVEEIARRMQRRVFKPKEYLVREGEPGDLLYVVAKGKVEVVMELKSGRPLKITDLSAGDVFGEIALLERVPRTRSVRAISMGEALTLSRDDFDSLVRTNLGAQKIREIVQKRSFLARLPLCRNWHPQAMIRFAQLANFADYTPGQTILATGRDNQFFFLVYEGLIEVRKGDKKLARLTTGDFFGEISLLQNSSTVADVVAIEKSRCLTLHKTEFLRFIAHDFFLGFQFEEISSKRLKHPIFPLTGISYDAHSGG